jgi:hypothetical protein
VATKSDLHLFRHLYSEDTDVIAVCFKQDCGDVRNMETYFYPHSSWTEARNKALFLARQRELRESKLYMYYLFLDQDFLPQFDPNIQGVKEFTQAGLPTQMKARSEWFYWETKLREYVPAMATVRAVGPCQIFGQEEVTQTIYMDAAVNAFHHTAAAILLPYTTLFDETTWWASQGVLLFRMRCLYGSTLQFNGLTRSEKIANEHAEYPRGNTISDHVLIQSHEL